MALARELEIVREDETLQDIMPGRVVADVAFYKAKEVDVRAVEQMHGNMFVSPWRGRFKMIIIDEAQSITKGAGDAFLSLLECIPDRLATIAVMETGNGADVPHAEIVKAGKSNLRACVQILEDYL